MNTSATKKIRLLLVDDHQLVRDGLRARLGEEADIEVVGEAGTGQEALSAAAILRPDLALVDIGLPDISGIQLTTTLNDRFPEIRVLILSMYDNREYVLSALRAGACGYVLKDAPSSEIISAIKGVAVGGTYYSTTVAKALAVAGTTPPLLTDREKEVLILLAQGDSNKRVAQKLDICVRTVETHRLNLRRKLGIETSAGLTNYALKQRWIEM